MNIKDTKITSYYAIYVTIKDLSQFQRMNNLSLSRWIWGLDIFINGVPLFKSVIVANIILWLVLK